MKSSLLLGLYAACIGLGLAGCANTSQTTPAASFAATAANVNANLVAGSKVICTELQSGLTLVATVDPAVVSHNTTTLARATAACALVNALPAPASPAAAPAPAASPAPAATASPSS